MTLRALYQVLDRGYKLQRTGWDKKHFITRAADNQIKEVFDPYHSEIRQVTSEDLAATDWKVMEGQKGGPIYAPKEV